MKPTSTAAAVPTVDFYGDATEWPTSALLHCEPLIERTRLHAFRIRPHRHNSLLQLFWLAGGTGTGRFDGERYALSAPCVIVVPERCVHEFEWAQDCDGAVLSLASALVLELGRQIDAPAGMFTAPAVLDATDERTWVDSLFARIQEEYLHARPWQDAALESLAKALAIRVARGRVDARRDEHASRARIHYERFTKLLERHYRSGWSVLDYARALGMTPTHLNAICRRQSGASALRVIHDRVLLAARRELIYTERSIADVAAGLGFTEPSYFTRFFKRRMRITPKQYRRRSGTL
jgi:AraC family transcriptional regulator, transcriptional activator of pobA